MKPNLGTIERIIRVILGAIFAYLYFAGVVSGTLGIILVVLAVMLVLTGLLSFCPLYYILKFSTRK